MYEQTFTRIESALRNDEGMSTELDYVEQISWLLFLKYLHNFEREQEAAAKLNPKANYHPIIAKAFRWDEWAMPRTADGQKDFKKVRTGEDLLDFVTRELFSYLGSLRNSSTAPNTTAYKIGEIFSELRCRFRSGVILGDIIDEVDALSFKTQKERHELSELYETRIRRMGNAGRNGGEYYTPRPLIRAMLQVVKPKIGETIYDGAAGSGGFLCEAYDWLRTHNMSSTQLDILREKTLFGQEKKLLPFIIGNINMILHGIPAPNLIRTNTLNENSQNIQESDRHHVILANPPFGGGERAEVKQNFSIQTSETAYLFLQHFIKKLRAGGRASVVIKNTTLSNADKASVELRKTLLTTCNLHSILDCPAGTFLGAGVKTVVLFFDKGKPTRDVWYYQLDPGRTLGKNSVLEDADFDDFVKQQKSRADSPQSWRVKVKDLDADTFDLSVRNPNAPEAAPMRPPVEILSDIERRAKEAEALLTKLREMV